MEEKEKDLYLKRGKLVKQCEDLKTQIREADNKARVDELKAQFKGFHDEVLLIDEKLKLIKEADEIDGIRDEQTQKLKETIKPAMGESVEGKREIAKKALLRWATVESSNLAPEEKKLLGLRDGGLDLYPFKGGDYDGSGVDVNTMSARERIKYIAETRAQSTTTTEGGDFIAQDFSREIEARLLWYGPFANREVCRVWASTNGATMPYPTVDDTSNTGALLSQAGDASSSVTDIVTAATNFTAYKYTSKLIKVNKELEEDSYFDIVGFVSDALATRLGRALNTAFTTGTGSSQPQGAVTGAGFYDWTASATAFTRPELQAFVMKAIDTSYMNRPLTRLMFHMNMLYEIRVLDDSSANYSQAMWQPNFAAGVPNTILGVPYAINNDMDGTMNTQSKIFLLGDFSKFICRWILPMRMVTLRDRYAETDQIGIVAFQRVDSHVIQSNAIKYVSTT